MTAPVSQSTVIVGSETMRNPMSSTPAIAKMSW